MHKVDVQIGNRKISIETGKVAKQASGSVIVSSGDTVVMVTACLGPDKAGDFLPLTVDYIEKTYAAGKIPGGYFRREGKLSEEETLISRVIDRPIRPLFAETFTHEVQVVATVLSADPESEADVLAMLGASAALHISEIPFAGPSAGIRVCRLDGKLVFCPTPTQAAKADINFVVAGTKDAILMVEGGANQVAEKDVLDAIFSAHAEMQVLIAAQEDLRVKCGKPKFEPTVAQEDKDLVASIIKFATPKIEAVIRIKDKLERRDSTGAVHDEVVAEFVKADDADAAKKNKLIAKTLSDLNYNLVRQMAF
jgi:polyribonucleotide nucleotidyltransferase